MNDVQQAPPPNGAPAKILEIIQQTHPMQIAELEPVRKKFIANYNHTHRSKNGDLEYHKQLINFKQLLAASDALRGTDPFSLYAVFVTVAANGYSIDPADNEIFIVPKAGKAVIWRQAGAHIRKLVESGQILHADQAQLVYEGDEYEVNRGVVEKHVEKYASDVYKAAYIRFELHPDSTGKKQEKYFTYRKSDWEGWRKKSTSTKTDNPWITGPHGQADPGFLRTKISKHAAMEKSWGSGMRILALDQFENVEYEELDDAVTPTLKQSMEKPREIVQGSTNKNEPTQSVSSPVTKSDEESFGSQPKNEPTVTVNNDDF